MIAEVVQGFLKWRAQVCLCLRREGWEGVAWMAPYYGRPGNLYLQLEQARVATAQAGRRRLPRWSR